MPRIERPGAAQNPDLRQRAGQIPLRYADLTASQWRNTPQDVVPATGAECAADRLMPMTSRV